MKAMTLLGTGAALTLAGLAQASPFNGFTVELVHSDVGTGDTYRIYANVDEGARIDAVFGNSENTLNIVASSGAFYQNGLGGATSLSINNAFFPLAPSVEWDSYVTVGSLYANGYPFASNELKTIGIDFSNFEAGGNLTTNNGSWFVTPVDPQGGELGGMVLIGQFTVATGASVEGYVSLQGKDANGETYQALNVSWVPAPGALALLGVAGLAGRRRRR
ncbi:MAG: hypothetical protein QF733_05915 [Phycisphaerales bacterium]|jgi:hypothetical protein|nr:hypothetical protein [Phycisphaerales bacterium]